MEAERLRKVHQFHARPAPKSTRASVPLRLSNSGSGVGAPNGAKLRHSVAGPQQPFDLARKSRGHDGSRIPTPVAAAAGMRRVSGGGHM